MYDKNTSAVKSSPEEIAAQIKAGVIADRETLENLAKEWSSAVARKGMSQDVVTAVCAVLGHEPEERYGADPTWSAGPELYDDSCHNTCFLGYFCARCGVECNQCEKGHSFPRKWTEGVPEKYKDEVGADSRYRVCAVCNAVEVAYSTNVYCDSCLAESYDPATGSFSQGCTKCNGTGVLEHGEAKSVIYENS